jgi:hypothetical protein
MKLLTNYVLIGFCLAGLPAALNSRAATVWSGPTISFSKSALDDPTLPANQDRLTANVWLTRGSSQGLYNAKTESSYTHDLSPVDTEWATGTTANYSSLSYTNWEEWARSVGGPPLTVGVNAVVHLISDDIYLGLTITSWPSRTGDYSYVRSTPAASNAPPTVSITSPTNGALFIAPATVSITASAHAAGGTVTNVSFFDGTTLLGGTNNSPYTVTATLAGGAHALTAVATDNHGLSATSAVVNVTVSVRLAVQVNGNQLDISWPVAGGTLQTQTNSLSVGIRTNWVNIPGSTQTNHVVVPIDPANGSVFYRLAFP